MWTQDIDRFTSRHLVFFFCSIIFGSKSQPEKVGMGEIYPKSTEGM